MEDGDGEIVVRQGSSLVTVSVIAAEDELITVIRAAVLDRLDVRQAHERGVLHHLNALNCRLHLGMFCLYEEARTIVLEHQILGKSPDPRGLLLAITSLAQTADDADDGLRKALGSGRRGGDARRRRRWPLRRRPKPRGAAGRTAPAQRSPEDDVLDV